jgi:hypothetical protein
MENRGLSPIIPLSILNKQGEKWVLARDANLLTPAPHK